METRDEDDIAGSDVLLTLQLLTAIEQDERLTQRSAAKQLGIALGLTNAYLRRCIKKGYVKVAQAPARRYAYYLTPTGFAEKGRLTAQYLSMSFDLFRNARSQYTELFAFCVQAGWTQVALAGAGDLAEIASLCACDVPVTLSGVIDADHAEATCAGLPVKPSLADIEPVQAVVVTDMIRPQAVWEELAAIYGASRVLAPKMLNISRWRNQFTE